MKVGLILVSVTQSTVLSRVSGGLGNAVAMTRCFWRENLCFSLLYVSATTLCGISTLLNNEKRKENKGKMGEVGPPAARLFLFTASYSHLQCSTGHPALRGQRLPPHWRAP